MLLCSLAEKFDDAGEEQVEPVRVEEEWQRREKQDATKLTNAVFSGAISRF